MCNLLFLSGASDGRCLKCRSSCDIWPAHFQIHCRYGKLWPFLADRGGQAGVQVEVALQLQPCYEYCQCNMRLGNIQKCSTRAPVFCRSSVLLTVDVNNCRVQSLSTKGSVRGGYRCSQWSPVRAMSFGVFDPMILLRVDYKGYLLLQSEWQFLNYPSNQGIG